MWTLYLSTNVIYIAEKQGYGTVRYIDNFTFIL